MRKAVLYLHGKGGNAEAAAHFKPFFPDSDVIGFDYRAGTPWEAKSEFPPFFDALRRKYDAVSVVADSIGAFFAMVALPDRQIERAYFISPVVDMEKLITDMMARAGVTEDELQSRKEIKTASGETLSWEYLRFVRADPVRWKAPTRILYGGNDALTPRETIVSFAEQTGAELTVMENGEHWFHTEEQMRFLDEWLRNAECSKEHSANDVFHSCGT